MNVIKKAWKYPPVRWAAIISSMTAATLLLLPGLHFGNYSTDEFLPHATCYMRDSNVIWLHVIGDAFIAVAYLSIAMTLGYIVYKARRDIPFHWMFAAFGLFIVFCGFTHVMGVITVWRPYYWLAGDLKAMTAVASVATAVILPATVPRVFSMIREAELSEQRKRDLEAAHQKLKESDELKSQFFANVSHELRTPLSLILGPIRRQLASGDLTAEEQRELEVVERNAGMLLQQVNNLLDLAKLEARRMKPEYARVDLAERTRLVASYFETLAAERGITYEVQTPENLIAEVDPDKMQRIFLNLLSNAFKFTPEGGRIRCILRSRDEKAMFIVEDTGPGIPEDLREAVFERFQQVDGGPAREAGGTGIGLAIVKEFVALHRGSIHLESGQDGGTKIELTVPLSAPQGTAVSETAPAAEYDAGRHMVDELRSYTPRRAPAEAAPPAERDDLPLVLVVEDNPDMNAFVASALRSRYRVATAFNGREGLEKARRLRPELIVSDIMMPQMSGDQMIGKLQAEPELREVPVVVLTAKTDEEQRVKLLEESVQDHLTKPFQADELMARVGGLIRRRRETMRKLREMNTRLEERVTERTELAKELQQRERDLERALETMRAAREEAERASQLKSDFLSLVSHELRTPLASLRLQIERMGLAAKSLPSSVQELIHRMDVQSLRLRELIEGLLNYTRIQSGRLKVETERLDVGSLARECAEEVRPQADVKDLDLRLELPSALPALRSDVRILRLIVVNLLTNAIKFTDSGSVTLSVSQLEEGAFKISVADTGPGIPPDEQRRIFEPFEQLELIPRKHLAGMGLGLALVRELVGALGGTITVDSETGKGSTFTVVLRSMNS